METIVDIALYAAYGLTILATAAAIGLSTAKLLQIPKEFIKLSVGIALLVVMFLISYALSSDYGHACNCEKLVSAFLFLSYFLFGMSFLGIVYLSASRYFQ